MKKLLYLASLVILFTGCNKEYKTQNKFSGGWSIESFETIFQSNGTVDSTINYSDAGYWLLYDNGDHTFSENKMECNHLHTPYSIRYINPWAAPFDSTSADYFFWYVDEKERLTVFQDEYNFTVYTVVQKRRNKMVLQYIESADSLPQGDFSYIETITLKQD